MADNLLDSMEQALHHSEPKPGLKWSGVSISKDPTIIFRPCDMYAGGPNPQKKSFQNLLTLLTPHPSNGRDLASGQPIPPSADRAVEAAG